MVDVHFPQGVEALYAVFVRNMDLADIAGNVHRIVGIDNLILGQFVEDGGNQIFPAAGGDREQPRLIDQPRVFVMRRLKDDLGQAFIGANGRHVQAENGAGLVRIDVEHIRFIEGEEQRDIGRFGPVDQWCPQPVMLAKSPKLLIVQLAAIQPAPAHGETELGQQTGFMFGGDGTAIEQACERGGQVPVMPALPAIDDFALGHVMLWRAHGDDEGFPIFHPAGRNQPVYPHIADSIGGEQRQRAEIGIGHQAASACVATRTAPDIRRGKR